MKTNDTFQINSNITLCVEKKTIQEEGTIMAKRNEQGLAKALEKIAQKGITADQQHLLEDIGAQFADYREWIREYVVNAYDAGAGRCKIWGEEDNERITIFVQDDGHGMDRDRVVDFMTLFRSVKEGDPRKAVGRFGVGKASILAIPGLIGLAMETSTGKEGWKMESYSLLDAKPVQIRRMENPGGSGTTFAVSYRKKVSLAQELLKLGDVLSRYLRYLPMTITVQNLASFQPGGQNFRYINDQWSAYRERVGRKYTFTINDYSFEAILGIGKGSQEIYQNHVLITDKYDLFFHDWGKSVSLPKLSVRIDSPDFELPFGRHGLRNEEILNPLSEYMRETILPQYFDELYDAVQRQSAGDKIEIYSEDLENLAVALLRYDCGSRRMWSRLTMFNVWGAEQRMSYLQLYDLAGQKKRLYLEDPNNPGADYTVFDAPVLMTIQPVGTFDLLQKHFGPLLVNLGDENMVLEQTVTGNRKLTSEELSFESALGFHTDTLARYESDNEKETAFSRDLFESPKSIEDVFADMVKLNNLSNEARSARMDLEEIEWRVNYLVERDGVTPCRRQKYLYTNNTVVLNLYHPEIRKLLELSKKVPALAGHWALAMCLQDSRKILSHLTPEAREELIRLDAVVRSQCVNKPPKKTPQPDRHSEGRQQFRDYLRMLAGRSGISDNIIQ